MRRLIRAHILRFVAAITALLGLTVIAAATTFITPNDDNLMIESRAIIRGKVISQGSAYDESTGFVYTYVKVRVKEVFKGNISTNTIILKEIGGEAGGHGTMVFSRPQFEVGEKVLLYLDTWPDGSLRVHDQFLGKFTIYKDKATGALMVQRLGLDEMAGAIPPAPDGVTTNKLEFSAYTQMLRQRLSANMQKSVEFETRYYPSEPLRMTPMEYNVKMQNGQIVPAFHVFDPAHRARWFQPDIGQPVTYLINTSQQPSANARADIDAAMAAWSNVSGCSLRVVDGGTTTNCSQNGVAVAEFTNCLGYFSPGGTCQGVIAEGGFNYTLNSKIVSGLSFYQTINGFIEFNPYSACSFSSDCNIEEITTHEMGHSLGLYHSWDPTYGGSPSVSDQQATMYYIAHFDGRCASVMSDDIAGISFIYPGSTAHQYSGSQDGAGCGTISGWAWDASNPGATVSVDIYDGSTLIATTPASMYREDLLNVLASPNHGFSYPTPTSLKNGASHTITVKISGTTQVLSGSPRTLQCGEASANLQGFHDGAGCSTISGWAWDANDPGNIVNVDIYNGATLLGTIAATQYRQDLANALGQPYHGFNFQVPASLKDGQPHTITVKFGGTNTNLSNTQKTFTCTGAAPNLQGSQDPASCSTISGYAWDANNNESTINVAIYSDGNFVVTIPAQQSSPGIGSGFHGFIFNVPASLKNGNPHSILVKYSGTATVVSNSPRTLTCP